MTNAFAIALLKQDIQNSKRNISYRHNEVGIEALELAIKALEQEPVLDKMRSEIEELDRYYDNDYFSTNNCPMYKCNEVLLIIDKYKAESEE